MVQSTLTNVDTLSIITLDPCFNYKFPKKSRRRTVKPTAKAVFIQKSTPKYLEGMKTIEWTIDIATCQVASQMKALDDEDGEYYFNGAWGEEYRVEIEDMDIQPYKGWFKISGTFRVLCLVDDFNPCENCP